jgi:pyruvate kinase
MVLARKTKIIATIGPASEKEEVLKLLVKEGIDAARLNFSHGSHAEHQNRIDITRSLSKKAGRKVAIIADLQGPKMRVGLMPEEGVRLEDGKEVVFNTKIKSYNGKEIPLPSEIFETGTRKGANVFLHDGKIWVVITKAEGNIFTAMVKRGGKLLSNKGVNVPSLQLKGSMLKEKDYEDIEFAKKAGVDYLSLSFMRKAKDLEDVKKLVKDSNIKLIAKIERSEAFKNLAEIVNAADAVMVARGDLGVETPIWALPVKQKEIIRIAKGKKPVIVATQMLESMTKDSMPTRAEVSDVANAVYEGADAVMLSAESATGKFPVEAVRMMRLIIEETEKNITSSKTRKEFRNWLN